MKLNFKNFKCGSLSYIYNDKSNCFESNYEKDFHIFIIWSKARFKEEEILKEINVNFSIVECVDTTWSQKYLDDNFHRIYDVAPTGSKAGKREEVGEGPFLVVVIEDLSPKYEYRSDASGRFKIVNSNVVDCKRLFRKWVGGSYMVHSTDNIMEFFNNSVLLFGKEKTFQLLEGKGCDKKKSTTYNDLVGASGWSSCEELFEVLGLTTEYVVLRGADNLKETIQDLSGDVDILCSNLEEFTAAANAINIWGSKNFFHVNIGGNKVLFDIRSVGDGYYDEKWQRNILKNKVINKGIYTPRVDDYFFSHLYHACVHKPYFYKKYTRRLVDLSKKIGIEDFESSLCEKNQNSIVKILRGYLAANKYKASIPCDEKVYLNIMFISRLEKISFVSLWFRVFKVKVGSFPSKLLLNIKLLLKRNATLFKVAFKLRSKFNSFFNR